MSNGSTTWNYTYDASGMRKSRTNGSATYTYVYNGGQLTQMTKGNDTLYFTYGSAGPVSVTWNGTTYYYICNAQGDVMEIIDSYGETVARYQYNAWGEVTCNGYIPVLAELNPLRYRGYVYDTETGLYYLQSRYYNPKLGRFLNADAYATTGQGMLLKSRIISRMNHNNTPPLLHINMQWRGQHFCEDYY